MVGRKYTVSPKLDWRTSAIVNKSYVTTDSEEVCD